MKADEGVGIAMMNKIPHRYGMGWAGQNHTHTHQHCTHMQTFWKKTHGLSRTQCFHSKISKVQCYKGSTIAAHMPPESCCSRPKQQPLLHQFELSALQDR